MIWRGARCEGSATWKDLDIGWLAPHEFSRAQIVFRAKQPGRMEKF